MGCGSSTDTAVKALTREEATGHEDDGGSKPRSCGDSAVSKGTTDSGVVMEGENLPGAVPRKLPPLTSEWITETSPGHLRHNSTAQERPKSSEILEELLHQGIIPIGQSRERSSVSGEAYSIMLNDSEAVRRRPPARLESLKAKKEQTVTSIGDIEEKIRLAEERRKLREEQLKLRLRAKSAHVRVRAPISRTEEDEDTSLSPVEPLESALSPDPLQKGLEEYEGQSRGNSKAYKYEMGTDETKGKKKVGVDGNRGDGGERVSEDGNEEEEAKGSNEVEEFLIDQGELESDLSFQHAEEKSELF